MSHLEPYAGTRRTVRIERNRPSNPTLNGYVLDCANGLAVVHQFDDFEPDGYAIIRECDIVAVRQGDYETLWDRMLEGEGLLGGLDEAPKIDLSSMATAIEAAAAGHPFLAIECEDEDEPIQDFYFAKVLHVTGSHVHLRCVDGLGQWEEPDPVLLGDITMVQMATPYLTRFAKYVP
jgi:hypothetical protein